MAQAAFQPPVQSESWLPVPSSTAVAATG